MFGPEFGPCQAPAKKNFEKVGKVQDTQLYSHADVCVQYISTRTAVCIVCVYIYIYDVARYYTHI